MDVNPYPDYADSARRVLYPIVPGSTIHQLLVLSALYVLIALAALGTVILVARQQGGFALFRSLSAVSDTGFWCPNLTLVFPTSVLVFTGLAQGYMWSMFRVDLPGSQVDQTGFLLWQTIIWIPLFMAGYSVVWSTVLTADLSRLASSQFSACSNSPSRLSSLSRFIPPPLVTNTLLSSVPLMFLISTLLPFLFANGAYNSLFWAWRNYDEIARDAAASFDGVQSNTANVQLSYWLQVMLVEHDKTVLFVRIGYMIYTVFGFLLFAASLAVLLTFARIMNNQVKALLAASRREASGEIEKVVPSYRFRYLTTKAQLRQFLFVNGSSTLVCGIYTVISLTTVVQPTTEETGSSQRATSGRMLAGLWTFALVGSVATGSGLWSALRPTSLSSSASTEGQPHAKGVIKTLYRSGKQDEYPFPIIGPPILLSSSSDSEHVQDSLKSKPPTFGSRSNRGTAPMAPLKKFYTLKSLSRETILEEDEEEEKDGKGNMSLGSLDGDAKELPVNVIFHKHG